MATLQYTVYYTAGAVAQGPVLNEGVVTISGTAAQSGAMESGKTGSRYVRIAVDTDCWVTWGANPTATVDGDAGRMMFAGSWEYVWIEAPHLISVIQRS